MTDRPIIMSAPMVLAILEGRKTQTRRLVTHRWATVAAGDRLWVREAFYLTDDGYDEIAVYAADEDAVREHLARVENLGPLASRHGRLRPSIHMPRWASRITLEVTQVRRQLVQEISDGEAVAEGMTFHDHGLNIYGRQKDGWNADAKIGSRGSDFCLSSARFAFANFWNSLHREPGTRWDDNPEVVAISFARVEQRKPSDDA